MQEDGAAFHHGGLLEKFKVVAAVRRLEWPPQSPDLSPIENIWREMKVIIGRQRHKVKNRQEMEGIIREVWRGFTAEVFMKYTNTMTKRMQLLKKARGGPIKY